MLVEIDERDLKNVIAYWRALDKMAEFQSVADFFVRNIKEVCERSPQKQTLEPFLRRPHITAHAGAKNGAEHCRDTVREAAYSTGRLVAFHGFNLWYGGGQEGLMGCLIQGFNDELKQIERKPDQYSVQIIPSEFVLGVTSTNGLHPVNEGLCNVTDAAIVMPDFVTRRELLDSRCVAAITCPGGTGSLDEWSDMVVHIKTGLRHMHLYTLNPYIDALGCGYYDQLRLAVQSFVRCGLESQTTFDHIHFKETAEGVFGDLMPKLRERSLAPDQVYAAYCDRHRVSPWGIPKGKKRAAHSPPECSLIKS